MFHPVARVAPAIGLQCCLIAVEHDPHRAVADGVDGDLQAPAVSLRGDRREAGGLEQRVTLPARMIGVILDHHRRRAVDHSVHEQLDEA